MKRFFIIMAIAVAETITGSITSGNTLTLTSWTPGSYDLCLLAVASREDGSSLVSSVSGNGLIWTLVRSIRNDDEECRLRVYRAMGSAPTSGVITIGLSGNSAPVVAVAVRLTGCDTSGVNGSGAVETSTYDNGPSGSNNDMLKSITTISTNAWAVAFGTHRSETFTTPGGETTISINNSAGSSSATTSCSAWYETTTTPDTVQLGESNDLGGNTDWVIIVVSLKPSLIEVTEVVSPNYRQFLNRWRKLNFKTAGGDAIMSAWGICHPLTSEYRGNEIEGIQVRNTIRVVLNKSLRQQVVQGDYLCISPVHAFLITSIKPFQYETEVIAVVEQETPASDPNVIKTFDLASGTTETTIWQPVSGKKFRLMEVEARIEGAASCKLVFRDGVAGSVILYGSTSNIYTSGRLGAGVLSSMVDNPLTVERSVAVTLQGHVLGFEE